MKLSSMLLSCLVIVLAPSYAVGQFFSDSPTWMDQSEPSSLDFDPHPGLGGVDSSWQKVLANIPVVVGQIPGGERHVVFHSLHGDIALYEIGSNPVVGRFDTGLSYIFDLSVTYNSSGAPSGVLVVGEAEGKARVLYSSWTTQQCPSTWSFAQVIPDSLPSVRYIRGDIIHDQLVLLDAVGEKVLRFNDNDADGVPDALTAPEVLDVSDSERPIWGFYSMGGDRIGVAFHPDGIPLTKFTQSELVNSSVSGALELSSISTLHASRAAAVHDKLVDGQTRIRVFGGYRSVVRILSGPSSNQLVQISGKYHIRSADGIAEVSVSPALRNGHVVRVVSSSISDSENYIVEESSAFMFPQKSMDDVPIVNGGGVLLRGVNLRKDVEVSVDVDGVPVAAKKTLVGTDQLFLSSLTIPSPASDAETLHIVVSHQDFRRSFEYWIGIVR